LWLDLCEQPSRLVPEHAVLWDPLRIVGRGDGRLQLAPGLVLASQVEQGLCKKQARDHALRVVAERLAQVGF
jgi:hypothetical protein